MKFCDVSTSSLLKLGYFKASNIPEETKAPKMNFDQSSGSIPRASYIQAEAQTLADSSGLNSLMLLCRQ